MAEFNSVFREEISMHLSVREAELSHETYRHYRRTMILFDEYLCRINQTDKEIPESVIESWIKEVSADISVNTSGQHVHYIRQLLISPIIRNSLKPKESWLQVLDQSSSVLRGSCFFGFDITAPFKS